MYETNEADEQATSPQRAQANLRHQVLAGETMGVIAMYEQAALDAGCGTHEIYCAMKRSSVHPDAGPTLVCHETMCGHTTRLSFAIKVF